MKSYCVDIILAKNIVKIKIKKLYLRYYLLKKSYYENQTINSYKFTNGFVGIL